MSEAEIQRQILVALNSLHGVRVFRNNCGFDGENRVRYGLAPGSADLIGWRVLSDGTAQFVSIEVKSPGGRLRPEQETWLRVCQRAGCCAGVARSVDEALAIVAQPPA